MQRQVFFCYISTAGQSTFDWMSRIFSYYYVIGSKSKSLMSRGDWLLLTVIECMINVRAKLRKRSGISFFFATYYMIQEQVFSSVLCTSFKNLEVRGRI